MRIWFKIFKDNHLLKDTVVEDNSSETRTHKIFKALDTACYEFDLASLSGWTPPSRNSSDTIRLASIRIIL